DFTTDDPGATLQVSSARTDATGKATALLSTTNPQARSITVRAAVQGSAIEGTRDIQVAGTAITINGPQTVAFNSVPSVYTVSRRDSASKAVPNVPVTLASASGNTIATSPTVTNSQGQATFNVTGGVGGADTLTASALGVSATRAITVSGTQLEFVGPATDGAELSVGSSNEVRVRLRNSGV